MKDVSLKALEAKTDEQAFQELAKGIRSFIHSCASGYMNNIVLTRLEDMDSLEGIGMELLLRVVAEYRYEKDLDVAGNDSRFLGQFRTYFHNKLRDIIRAQLAGKRCPESFIHSLDRGFDEDYDSVNDRVEMYRSFMKKGVKIDAADPASSHAIDTIEVDEIVEKVTDRLQKRGGRSSELTVAIWKMHMLGMSQKEIAKDTNQRISRVSYLLNNRIKPVAAVIARQIYYV